MSRYLGICDVSAGKQDRLRASLVPRPFPLRSRVKSIWWVETKRGKGSGKSSKPSTGNGRNAGAVRMKINAF